MEALVNDVKKSEAEIAFLLFQKKHCYLIINIKAKTMKENEELDSILTYVECFRTVSIIIIRLRNNSIN